MSQFDNDVELEDVDAGFGGDFGAGSEDESINSALKIKSNISIKLENIKIEDIITSNFKKISRSDTLIGLSGVVGEWGVVTPIHVLKLEEDDFYMIFDGLRRVFGALRSGKKEIPAMIWDFEDKQEGKEKANLLSLMINRSQRFTAKEQWEQMQILEDVNGASPGLIEFLLQMHSGDAMKLKDVMLSDVEYSEIRQDLMSGVTSIDQAYKKLCNERRKENRLAKEDALVLEGGIGADPDEVSDEQHLSVDDVKDLLDLTNTDVGSSLEDLDRTDEAIGEPHLQTVGDRHPLDPELRKAVLERDSYKCRCCGTGGTESYLSILAVHHIIPVYLSGYDEERNLVTLCVNHHLLVHNYAEGKIRVNLEDLTDKEKEIFRNVFKYGNVIIEAKKRIGLSKEESKKLSAGSLKHPFPDQELKSNLKATSISAS